MPVSHSVVGDVAIVSIAGELTAASGDCPPLRDAVRTVLDQGHRKLAIDLTGATHLDSTGLGEIVYAYASTTSRGGTFRLVGPCRRVMEVLVIAKLVPVLKPTDTQAEAIANLSPPNGQA